MAKKKIPKSRKVRLVVFGIPCVVAFLFCCLTVVRDAYKIIALTNEEKALVEKLDNLKNQKELLENEIEKLHDSEYLARFARENYYYTKEGEYVIKKTELEELESDTEEELSLIKNALETVKNNGKIVVFISLGALAFIIIQVIKRK